MPVYTPPAPPMVKQRVHWIDHLAYAALALVALILVAFLAAPLLAILQQALLGKSGDFIWFDNFIEYAKTPALLESLWNSLWVSAVVTLVAVPLAFGFAYALTRSCMQYKALFRGITLIPLLAPSLLSAISLIYWFGNQGVLKGWMQGWASTDLRRARHRGGRMLRGVPACADDPGHGAHAVGRAPL
jgi:iron(III) transport system permease protein